MLICNPSRRRRGVTAVESAFALPVALFLMMATAIGGLGMYRYQEVAHLARMGARHASTHGGNYAKNGGPQATGVPAVSSSQDLLDYLLPKTILLDPANLQVNVS